MGATGTITFDRILAIIRFNHQTLRRGSRPSSLILVAATNLANFAFCAVPIFIPWRIPGLPFDQSWLVVAFIGLCTLADIV